MPKERSLDDFGLPNQTKVKGPQKMSEKARYDLTVLEYATSASYVFGLTRIVPGTSSSLVTRPNFERTVSHRYILSHN